MQKPTPEYPVICWWSGGVTSAVACFLAVELYGIENVVIVFIDTKNEDADTYRFKEDCAKWYGCEILSISRSEYQNIKEVWYEYLSLNVATGAICSAVLKREMRVMYQKANKFSYQVFGFDITESKRALAMTLNYKEANPIFLLMLYGYTKGHCFTILKEYGITPPRAYEWGFNNNNCLETGCVQGGIGYWQLMKVKRPEVFYKMAAMEHDLTNIKGKPVTMLKDQGKNGGLVFLMPHPGYPEIKDISMMKGRPPKPLMECNGHCGINDLDKKNETEKELNYQA